MFKCWCTFKTCVVATPKCFKITETEENLTLEEKEDIKEDPSNHFNEREHNKCFIYMDEYVYETEESTVDNKLA